MNKAVKKFAILAGIFLAAAGIYFFTSLNNMEQSDFRRIVNMGAAAKLYRFILYVYDPYDIAVLFSEQRHRAELSRLVNRHFGIFNADTA